MTSRAESETIDRSHAAVILGVLLGGTFVIYGPILKYMVLHWNAVADYSHGFIVAPLAVYFAWQRRAQVARVPFEPTWWGLLPLLLSTLTLVIGRLGVELMNMRVSFVLALNGIVLLLLGWRAYKVLAFPLLFAFLMVPLPQSLVNVIAFPLQLIAANFAAQALYWLGIPALLEGNIIHLADTQLFVEEACSGLRSLMALVTLGVIFAYFFRKTWGQRIIIVLSAIPIAIVVNAFRVGLTGVLTHFYGKEAAGGWDPPDGGFVHLRARFHHVALRSVDPRTVFCNDEAPSDYGSSVMILKVAAVVVFLATNYYAYYHLATVPVIPERSRFSEFPDQLGEWVCPRREDMSAEIEANLGVTDYLICNWVHRESGSFANLYVGYHETQVRREGGGSGENAIHPPKHCLPGSGWNIIAHEIRDIDIAGLPVQPAQVNRLLIAKGNLRQVVYYWYLISRPHHRIRLGKDRGHDVGPGK